MPILRTHPSVSVPGHRFARVTGSRFAGAVVIGVLLVPLLAGPVSARGPAGEPSDPTIAATHVVHDSWIVRLQPGASPAAEAPGLARGAGGSVGLVFPLALNGFQFHGSAAAAQALSRLPHVASVTPDRPMHLIESLPNGIERIWAFDNDTPANSAFHQGFRGNGARIAVLDTGVDVDHPDLVGAIDHSLGKNCVNPALPPEDGYGHGTHVSGTAMAPLNGVGVVGVAPEARLVPVKIFDDAGNSSEALVLCGFNHVLALNADGNPSNDVDVMSMSFGEDRSWGDCVTDPLHTAVCNAYAAGIIMVAGAGNSAVNAGTFVPAAFPEVISVSALADFDAARGGLAGCGLVPDLGWFDCDDTFAFFSNYGASVDVMAPGVSIFSTTKNAGYATQSGTSMATPHVSGVVALMAAANPGLTPAAAVAFLRESGECPDGTVAGVDGTCSGQGTWADDPDGTPEPLANALGAALAAGGTPPTPTPPAAPTLTSATPGDGSVALAWTTPATGGSALTGYEVWRSTTSGTETLLTPVPVQTTFTDLTVTNGTTYYYQVKAVNGVGPGPLSNELSATPAAPTPPAAPTLTSATPGDGSVALAWTTPATGGSALTGYEVWRSTTSGTETLLTPVPVQTTFTDLTVTNGTTYYYQVKAVNGVGPGPLSNELSATPAAPPPTVSRTGGTVSNFASTSSNAGSIGFSLPTGSNALVAMLSMSSTSVTVTSMTWKPDPANPGADQALTSVGRRVAPSGGAVEIWALLNPTPGQPGSAVAHTLSGNVKRIVGVHALRGVGTMGTPVGAGVNGTSIGVTVPSVSGGLVLDVVYGQNSTTGYTAGSGQTEHWDTNTTGGLDNLRGTGSSEAGAASVSMTWASGAGTNMALLAVGFSPEPPPAPTAPAAPDLTAATAGNGSVALTWTTPADGGSALTGYEVWRSTTSGSEAFHVTVPVQNSYTDTTNVANGTTYFYKVKAVNGVGPGPLSNERSATPTAPPAPTAPAAPNLTAATAGNGSVALTWTTPADGGSAISGYEVWRSTTTGSEAFHVTVPVQNSYIDTTNVANGTTYFYKVKAVNGVGPGPLSNERSATPTAPLPTVTRTGGTFSNFASASNAAGSIAFSLPNGTNALVAMVSVSSSSVSVTSVTWKPDPASPGADQALSLVGRQTVAGGGAVEIWALLNPTPGQPGSAVAHALSGSVKRVMGVHALAGVATIGTPVGVGANATSVGVTVPSVSGGLVFDVLYGQNSTTGYTAGSGQTERWDTNTTSGLSNLRGAGSEEVGASSVAMTWTANAKTKIALLGVSFNPAGP